MTGELLVCGKMWPTTGGRSLDIIDAIGGRLLKESEELSCRWIQIATPLEAVPLGPSSYTTVVRPAP